MYFLSHAISVYIRWVNQEEHGTEIETVRYRLVNLVGQDSTKKCVQYNFKCTSVYSDPPTKVLYVKHSSHRQMNSDEDLSLESSKSEITEFSRLYIEMLRRDNQGRN